MPYKVPFVNYPLQYRNIKNEIDEKFQSLLSKGDLYLRDDCIKLERDLAAYLGVKYGIGTNSGTDSIFLSLYAEGIGKGDEVITVGHTYIATISSIVHTGARPILIDVKEDFNMDVDQLEKAVTPRTRAVIPVHLNGHCCEMDRIMEIAEEHDLMVVEDAAQALGASYKGKKAGSFGDTGCFSFYPAKILGCYGDGGFIAVNDDALAEHLYLLRDNGEKARYLMKDPSEAGNKKIYLYGFNSVMDNIQAAVLNIKLKYFPQWLDRRREIAKIYDEGLAGVPGIRTPPDMGPDYYDVYQNYVIRSTRRDELAKFLDANGVETLISWKTPNHLQEALDLSKFKLPETERISREVISLPMYPELTDEQVQYVVARVRAFSTSKR